MVDAKEIAEMLKYRHRVFVQTERGLYWAEVQHDAAGVPAIVSGIYDKKVNLNDVVHASYADFQKALSLALSYFYYQEYLGLKPGESPADHPRPPPDNGPMKRVIVKRPWGYDAWTPDLVKKSLAEGHLSKKDIVGVVDDNKATDVINKLNQMQKQERRIVKQNLHQKQQNLNEKPNRPLNQNLNQNQSINKEEYKKLLIKEIEKQLGTKIDELPEHIRKQIIDAVNKKVENPNVKIEILGLNLPSLTNIQIQHNNKNVKPSMEDKMTEKSVELEYEGSKTSNVAERLKIGAELAGLGFVAGVINVGKSVVKLGEEATHNPAKAAKDLVTGTIGWFASIPEKLQKGFTESPFYAGELAGEITAGEVVGEGIKVATKPIPRPAFAKLTVLEGGGADPKLGTIRYGITIHALEKPLLTIAKTDEGVKVGRVLPAPKEAIEGKTITAYSKLETEFFKKTVEEHAKSPEHAEVFELGHEIASKIYSTKEPVVKPEKFEILSEHIPEKARPAVKEAITSYKGDIEVYGSVAQKLQMGEYMTRQPKDIEVVVDKPEKFVEKLEEKLKNAGIEYKIEGSPEEPKVYFKIGEEWVKGIEIFSKKSKEGYLGLFGGKRSSIEYGFERQKPVEAEGVEMLRLSEQAARKLEGGHVFKEGEIVPKHEGRWKDVSDLIEIGTAYALEKDLPIEEQLVRYAKLQMKLHSEYIESPIARFIAKEGRLPTPEEIAKIAEKYGLSEEYVKDLLFKSEKSSILRGSDIVDLSYYLSIPEEFSSISPIGIESLSKPLNSSSIKLSSSIRDSSSIKPSSRLSSKSSRYSQSRHSSPKINSSKHSSKPVNKSKFSYKPSNISKFSRSITLQSSPLSSLKSSSSVSPSSIAPEISVPNLSPPDVSVRMSKRSKSRKSKTKRSQAEWNIYNVFGDPLKVASKVDRAVSKILRNIL